MRGLRINNYEVLDVIGEGGMGTVYLARHPFIGRQAAIKVLRPELARDEALVTRFVNEARAANAIHHPNLIDIIDVGMLVDGTPYLMMEFLDGQSLGALLATQPRLPVPQALDLACQAASALAATHEKGIVHRDLKPDNLFLVPQPTAKHGLHLKVLDFGIAKLMGDPGNPVKTRTGVILGTPVYMSPEQCRGITNSIDHRSDIYSLGVILYHMVCGRPPFLSGATGEIMAMHLISAVPPPTDLLPDLHPGLAEVILHALAKAPQARFASMAELEAALHAVEDAIGSQARSERGSPAPVKPAPPAAHPAKPERPRPAGTGAAAAGRANEAKTRPRQRRALAIGGGVLLAGAVAAGLLIARARSLPPARPRPVPPAADRAAAPPKPVAAATTVTVAISTSPSEADIMNAATGELLGITPYQASLPREDRTLQVVVLKAGYQPQPRALSLAQDSTLDLILVRQPESRAAQAKPKAAPRRAPHKIDPDAMRKL